MPRQPVYNCAMRFRVAGAILIATALGLASCAPSPKLLFLCSNEESICEQWSNDFEAETGIATNFLRLPTSEALARITAAGGAPEFDAWVGGPSDAYVIAKQRGLLEPYRPQHWDAIPETFKDSDLTWIGVYGSVLALCSNPDVLASNGLTAPTSWADLEDPALKGLISASSPLTSGTASTALRTQADIFGERAEAHLSAVYDNVSRFTHSGTAPARVVANGEAAVAISFVPYCFEQNAKGARLTVTYPREGTFYEVGAAALLRGLSAAGPGENFLDWLSSAAAQSAMSRAGIPQQPITTALPQNLSTVLQTIDADVIDLGQNPNAEDQARWLQWAYAKIEHLQ